MMMVVVVVMMMMMIQSYRSGVTRMVRIRIVVRLETSVSHPQSAADDGIRLHRNVTQTPIGTYFSCEEYSYIQSFLFVHLEES